MDITRDMDSLVKQVSWNKLTHQDGCESFVNVVNDNGLESNCCAFMDAGYFPDGQITWGCIIKSR